MIGIPVHLLTREALQLYWQKIADRGVLAFHISNTFLDLAPLVTSLARDAGLVCLVQYDAQRDKALITGKAASQWAVMARSTDLLGPLALDKRWQTIAVQSQDLAWTDDFSNPLGLVRWFGK